jgi:hypothetical protein
VGRGGVNWGVVDAIVGDTIQVHEADFPIRRAITKVKDLC